MTLHKLLPLACAAALAACGGEPTQERAASSASAPASAVVDTNGRLRVCGNRICSTGGAQVQLKGMSWFWSNTTWGAERFYNGQAVASVAGWGATVVRAAIGVHGGGGYLSGDSTAPADPAGNLARARALIDGAISAGVYVIVDWHSHELHQAEAQQFFQTLATQYASSPNIIWETFNEPPGGTYSWATLKPYHEAVIRTIRAAGSQNLVVVGSPNWSQDVDVASSSPITSDTNVAYALHFYAGTHGQFLRDKANTAMSRGVAVFVTEYGTVDASGNGGYNETESNNWATWMDQNKISSANWSLHDKNESASALVPGSSSTGSWADSSLTQSGRWVKAYIGRGGGGGTTFALNVTKSGTGSGTVTSNTGGINCGSTCSATYASGTTVTLTATAASGSTFAGWSNGCTGTSATCTVSMTAARTVNAAFNTSGGTTFALTVTRSGTGSGTVTSNTGGINCGSTCSATYASGTTVTLTATAASGSTFAGWSGACTGTSATCSVSMTAARTATATFNTSGGGTTPCANPVTFATNTGNFNSTGAVCYRTATRVNGWGCSNFTGRTVSVNGGTATTSCGAGPFPLAQVGGYTYFSASAGTYPWASIYIW
jgi:endoglucanase